MCDGGMYALIRTKVEAKVGIRCNFSKVVGTESAPLIEFSGISSYGLSKLTVGERVKFEVIGMPSQVIFQTQIQKISHTTIRCPLPKDLITIERRAAARYATTRKLMAYLKLSVWKPSNLDTGAPPTFGPGHDLTLQVPILDISIGGVCLKTNFPSVLKCLEGIKEDSQATLVLPMTEPIALPTLFRWQRRIRNRQPRIDDDRYQLEFRIGVEFAHLNNEQVMRINQFIRQLSIADAI